MDSSAELAHDDPQRTTHHARTQAWPEPEAPAIGGGGADDGAAQPTHAAFRGSIGATLKDSTPAWPEKPTPPAGAPNVVFIVLDDIGFAQLGCYGGPIETPHIDGLASEGLRYTNWYTTSLCCPTRACLRTGRNHYTVGMGVVTEAASGFPGYNASISVTDLEYRHVVQLKLARAEADSNLAKIA